MSKGRKECGKGEGGNVAGSKYTSQKSKREVLRSVQQFRMKQRGLWGFTGKLRCTVVVCPWRVVKHFLLSFSTIPRGRGGVSPQLPYEAATLGEVNRNSKQTRDQDPQAS